MSTLYDLDQGQSFCWKDDIFVLVDHGEHGTAHAHRVGTKTEKGWMYGPALALMNNNFNAYAEVEPGQLVMTWEPTSQ